VPLAFNVAGRNQFRPEVVVDEVEVSSPAVRKRLMVAIAVIALFVVVTGLTLYQGNKQTPSSTVVALGSTDETMALTVRYGVLGTVDFVVVPCTTGSEPFSQMQSNESHVRLYSDGKVVGRWDVYGSPEFDGLGLHPLMRQAFEWVERPGRYAATSSTYFGGKRQLHFTVQTSKTATVDLDEGCQ
jgi:hypothetical protein